MAGTSVGWLEAFLGLNDTDFHLGLKRAQASMKIAGQSMKRIGSSLTTSLSLPLALVGGAAISMSRDFEKSLSKIEGLVGVSRKEVQAMRSDVLSLSGATGRAPQELADALFFVTSAGMRGSQALDVLRMSAKASASGLGETKTIADLVTSAVSAYGPELLNASKATDILTAAVREGKAEAPALAASLGQILPIASNMGVSFDQIGAAVAAMTRTGTDAGTASIQLRQILASLLKPAQQSEDALTKMGTSSANLRKQLKEEGLVSVLGFLAEQMKTNEQAMADVFPNVRALSGALDIMGANAKDNIGIFKRMTDTTGTLDKAFDVASQTADFKFNQALAGLKTAAIDIGVVLMPAITSLLGWVKDAVNWFSQLSGTGQAFAVTIGVMAIAIGPLLTLFGTLATVIGAITLPIAAVVGAIAVLGASFLWVAGNWDALVERIGNWDWWKLMLTKMLKHLLDNNPFSWLIDKYNQAMLLFGKVHLMIKNPFTAMEEGVDILASKTIEFEHQFTDFFTGVEDGAKKAGKAIAGLFPSGGTRYTGSTPSSTPAVIGGSPAVDNGKAAGTVSSSSDLGESADWWETQIDYADQLTRAVQGALVDSFVLFGETMGDVFSGMSSPEKFFQGLLGLVADFSKGLGEALIAAGVAGIAFQSLFANPAAAIIAGTALIATAGIVKNIMNDGPGGYQGLRSGGFVTEGGVFQLHKDELVTLPAGAAVTSQRDSRAMMGGGGSGSIDITLRKLLINLDKEQKRMNR